MVILYPSDNGNWTLSLRESQGHDDPEQKTSSTAESPLVLLPALISSSAESTLVSFIRPLSLPSSQTFFKHDTYLNLSRSSGQEIIYAFSGSRPGAGGQIEQHGGGEFGSATVNLALVFDASKGSARPDWTRYDTFILVHGEFTLPGGQGRVELTTEASRRYRHDHLVARLTGGDPDRSPRS